MSESNIRFNESGAKEVLSSLEKDTSYIEEMFDKIDFIMEYINGDYEIWKGPTQEKFYENFKTISKKFDGVVKGLEKNNEFLAITINNYSKNEGIINENVNMNKDNLDIN